MSLNLKQIAMQTGINTSTAYRLLAHLEREGYLARDHAAYYSLGMKLLQLAAGGSNETSLRETAGPVLRELARSTEETVNLAVVDQGTVLYLDVVESSHIFRLVSTVGLRRPLYSTALGKALLAFAAPGEAERVIASLRFEVLTPRTITSASALKKQLKRIRQRGFSVDDEEAVLGARCIAAPVLNAAHEAVAAISLAGPTARITQNRIRELGAAVMAAAQLISARMG